jgi:hypothetical protein
MTARSFRASPQEMYQSFVREFASSPQSPEMLDRLRHGHRPDEHGWCEHPAHAHRWERYPCSTLQLAEFVDAAGRSDRARPAGDHAGAPVDHEPEAGGPANT